ncbi:hypothetical protein GCM10010082_18530 [Kushneria pakistanensis]|uniref:DUF2946 domain-containing protein n=1 Tax=Kushneria pakistanensis TaxID=1508770 RepID=A0ABQ3FIK6_9GAMM|nr:DUF2946 domain-containing protein [Kushneria pakistanensis]GHC25818.1 hypothetical protein GCM10010082_18530 [Kushneria pakistanensis]
MTRLRCSFPAWLALAAMLVIFMAPVLSQTLALAHERERTNPAPPWHDQTSGMHAGHVMAGLQTLEAHQAGTVQYRETHPAGHMDLAQCGYCSLLAHTPLMVEAALALPPSRAGPDTAPVPSLLQGHARHPHFPNALSRAPPLSV